MVNSPVELQNFLDSQTEWLLVPDFGKTFPLGNTEIEIAAEPDKILFGFLDDKGFQTWRVVEAKIEDGEIRLNLSRNFGKERKDFRLIPRISAQELATSVELARLEKTNKLAALLQEEFPRIKLVRVALNEENGRFANIIFENPNGEQTAVLADVSETLTPEVFLTTAIFWLTKLESRRKNPVETIWIVAEKSQARNLQKLHALLKESWKERIKIIEISRRGAKTQSEESLKELSPLRISALWRAKPKPIRLAENAPLSETAQKIIALAPGEIDSVSGKQGETLRFSGLPFARVRRVFENERTWFGIERNAQILSEKNWDDLCALVQDLGIYRSFDTPNARHAFYHLAPETWLESLLRRNIKLLDANLILSPLYHQFRAERDRVDLLALRRDGRLVVIELKTSPDREMIFQAADYWRKIELERRKGNLTQIRLFGEAEISDRPAIVYLVAPTLEFHRDFKFLANTISPEIEIHRFDLNENWRENLKVVRRHDSAKK
jgi:hypothetical protein